MVLHAGIILQGRDSSILIKIEGPVRVPEASQ